VLGFAEPDPNSKIYCAFSPAKAGLRSDQRAPSSAPFKGNAVLEYGPTEILPPIGANWKTLRVSADPVAKPAALTRAESRGSRPSKADAGERQTLRWREMDSNHRSRHERAGFCCGRRIAGPSAGSQKGLFFYAVPMVRIHLPPADSLSLSRSSFRRSRTRLSARVWAAGLATGSAETRRVFRYRVNRRQYLCRAIFQYRGAAGRGAGLNAR